jgi:hypothetical protein
LAHLSKKYALGHKKSEKFKEEARQRAIKQWEDGLHDNQQFWPKQEESYAEKIFRVFLEDKGAIKGKKGG